MDLQLEATRDRELLGQPEEPAVMVQVELNKTAEAREEAIRLADAGDFGQAKSVMDSRYFAMASMENLSEDLQIEMAEELKKVSESVQTFENRSYDAKSRKKMSYENYQRRNTKKS
jgi:Ca-activated chloride channel family protein